MNEKLLFEVIIRDFKNYGDYTFLVRKNKLYVTHKCLFDRYVKKAYTAEDILELMNIYPDDTLFSAIIEDVSYITAKKHSGNFETKKKKGITIFKFKEV